MANVLTVDVEDYYHGVPRIAPSAWDGLPPRLDTAFPALLEWLDAREIRATIFVLGAVAARYPHLIREAAAQGHEVASHGWSHTHLAQLSPAAIRKELEDSRALLEDLAGQPLLGFRAPYFSVTRRNRAVLAEVAAAGYRYDSSVFPTRNHVYGIYSAPLAPYELEGLDLVEFPPSTVELGGFRLPVAGGFYLRVLPAAVVVAALERLAGSRRHTVVYFHPWEFDGKHPRVWRTPLEYLLLGHGVRGFRSKLDRLVSRLRFTSFRTAYFADGMPHFPALALAAL